jgi:hypothetical protein
MSKLRHRLGVDVLCSLTSREDVWLAKIGQSKILKSSFWSMRWGIRQGFADLFFHRRFLDLVFDHRDE